MRRRSQTRRAFGSACPPASAAGRSAGLLRALRALVALAPLLPLATAAQVPIETPGRVERLSPAQPHWAVVSDLLLRRAGVLDLDSGRFLGMFDTGFLSIGGVFPAAGGRFYVPETFYSRHTRGERTDVLTFYDLETLAPEAEVVIPPKRAVNVLPSGNAALLDDGRFVVVFNMTPATSVSVVDVVERRFAGEIETPGCSLVYPAGPRRFFMLCANGALLVVRLDARGALEALSRSEPFFDPLADPLTEKGVRIGDQWIFASFEGRAVPIDVAGAEVVPGEPWPLVGEVDRAARWRIGGTQHLAAHAGLGRLYSLVHQGGPDGHKEPGTELWVYDVARRERVQRIALRHPGYDFLGQSISFGSSWPWPFNGTWDLLLDTLAPDPGISHVAVTQDDAPLIVAGSSLGGSLALYDARTGEFLRRVASGNFTVQRIQLPWGAP